MLTKYLIRSMCPSALGLLACLVLLSACQSMPQETKDDIDNDVCIGEAVVVDPDQPIDLEKMANEVECETETN